MHGQQATARVMPSRQPQTGATVNPAASTGGQSRNPAEIDFGKIRLLSGEGELAANTEQQKFLCFLEDGRLFIAEGKRLDHQVQSYMAGLTRKQRRFMIVDVSMAVIAKMYAVGAGASGRQSDHSKMVLEAKALIDNAAQKRASDIHVRVKRNVAEIYFRIHGDLKKIDELDHEHGMKLLRTYYQAMADISDDTFKENSRLDARIASRDKLPDNIYGVRIATTPTDEANLMVLRLLYNDTSDSLDPRELGFGKTHRALMKGMIEQPIGMNIICGPTGSGKSTTLQRLLRWQITESEGRRHVITVEDPPEYPIEGSVQTPVANAKNAEERSVFFAEAISNAMRLDPDTIMIGEMRDLASAQMALRAAMTGHQVWTTVHANSAMAIIDRLVDLGLPIEMLTDHTLITGLIAQRLVRVLCPKCKRKLTEDTSKIQPDLFDRLKRTLGANWTGVHVMGDGCEHCKGSGTIGRTVVSEVIVPDPKFMELIRCGDRIGARAHWLKEQGGTTFISHALEKIANGEVDPVSAERIVGRLHMDNLLSDATLTVAEMVGG